MFDRLIETLNFPYNRLGLGLIIAGTIACPSLNNFVDNHIWLYCGIIFYLIVIFTVITGLKFTSKAKPLIGAIAVSFIFLCIYLFIRWGHQASF